jgi:hypothetical protein
MSGLQYVYPTNFGTFTWLTQVSYLDSFEFQGTPDARTAQLAGVAVAGIADTTSVDGNLRWKGVQRLDWSWNGFDIVGTGALPRRLP